MNLKKTMKICASVLLAIMIVGMPWYLVTSAVFGTGGDYDSIPPENELLEVSLTGAPPICIMEYPTQIAMTTNSEFMLGDYIQFDNYFYDEDGTALLSFGCEYPEESVNVIIDSIGLVSITTTGATGEFTLTLTATDGDNGASYDIALTVISKPTIEMDEDENISYDMTPYVSIYDNADVYSTPELEANLNFISDESVSVSITPKGDWFGDGAIMVQTTQESILYPIENPVPIPTPIVPILHEASLLESLGFYMGYCYKSLEFDVHVSAVNDKPVVTYEYIPEFEITTGTSAVLHNSIPLNMMFSDVDSELTYSWSSNFGLATIEISDSNIVSVTGKDIAGFDYITIVAYDGEYAVPYEINARVVPRTTLYMTEDVESSMELGEYIDTDSQQIYLSSSGNIEAVIADFSESPEVFLSSGQNWFGSDVVLVQAEAIMNSINPPYVPITIQSAPNPPAIPPDPTEYHEYEFYEFDVEVAPVNDPPYAISIPDIIMEEDEVLSDAFNIADCFADVDSTLTYTLTGPSPNRLNADLSYGNYVDISPTDNWYGTETITIEAFDGEFTASQNIGVTVMPVNDVPHVTDAAAEIQTDEDTNISICLSDYIADIDDALWFSFVTDDTNTTMELDEETWNLTITPNENWNGALNMTVFGSDSEYQVARDLVLEVMPVNDRPVIVNSENITLLEDGSLELDMTDYITDIDSELEYTVFSCRGKLVCEMNQGTLWNVNTASEHWNGNDVLRIFAYDGQYMVNLNLGVEVCPVNNAPEQLKPMSRVAMLEDTVFSLDVGEMFSDIDGDTLQYGLNCGECLQIALNTEQLTVTIAPEANWFGESTVTVGAFDGAVWNFQDIPVTVSSVNDPPFLSKEIDPIIMNSGNRTVINLSGYADDVDSTQLTLDILGTGNVTVNSIDRDIFEIETLDTWEGSDTLTVRISDGENTVESAMVVSAYVQVVETQSSAAGENFFLEMSWMGVGMVVAIVAFSMYTATNTSKADTRTPTNKGRVL